MHHLEVPEPFSGTRVKRNQTVREQIGPDAVRPIVIVGRRPSRKVRDSAFLIEGNLAPCIRPTRVLPSVRRPSLITEFAGMRNRMETPRHLSRNHVVSANIAGRREIRLAGG